MPSSSRTLRGILPGLFVVPICIVPICLVATQATPAQVGSASLSGVVQDSSGAVIPNATVIAHNVQTGQDRTSKSNGSGGFTFSAVPNGDYDVTVSATGFSPSTLQAVHLDPGDNKALNALKLNAGDNVSVTVNTESAGIPLDSGQLSSTISAQQLDTLSVVGRDAQELEKTLPGFNIRGLGNQNTAPDFTIVTIGQPTPYASNGAPVAGIVLKLDGANLTDAGNNGANLQNLNDSFVSEVQVQTSNFGVDQSNGPVVISAVTKAGTATLHGQVYTFARYAALNANDWLNKFSGNARPESRFIYPGGQVSGPVPYTHKKITFFAGAEDDAQRNVYAYQNAGSALIRALVPTQAMRNGDFSLPTLQAYLGPNFNNYGRINVVPTVGDNGTRLVNGNISAFLDPQVKNLINYVYPLPNRPGGVTGADGYNWSQLNLVNNNVSQYTGRLDYAISPRNTAFGRYSFEKGKEGQPQVPYYSPQAGNVLGSVNTPGYGLENRISVHSAAANYVTIFSATATNELFAALTYFQQSFVPRSAAAVQASTAGFGYTSAFNNGNTGIPQIGTYAAIGGLPLALTPDFSVIALGSTKFQPNVGDNFTKVVGKHTFKVGIFSQRTSNNGTSTGTATNGVIQNYFFGDAGNQFFDYNGTYANGTPAFGNPHYNSGNWLADFLEGHIQDYHQQNYNPKKNLYFWNTEFYGQDSWRVTQNVLVNFGVRFSHQGAWTDRGGIGAAIWDPTLINTTQNPTTNPYPGLTWHALTPSVLNSGTGAPGIFVEPRGGLAWDVFSNGKTVVRGGAGVYRFHDALADVAAQFSEASGVRTLDLQGFGGNTLKGIGTLHLDPATYGNSGGTATAIPPSTVYGLDATDKNDPVTNNYSFSIAQQLPRGGTVQVSYVGNNSNSLLNNGTTQTVVLDNVNAIPVGTLFTPTAAAAINKFSPGACSATGCTPQQASSLDTIYNYPGDKSIQNARPYPRYNQILVPHHNNFANYNALQVEFIKQSGKLTYNVNYTFSKSLGILGSAADFNYTAGIDPFNLLANYGPLNFDRSQVVNFSYSYQTGKTLQNRLAGAVVNNWLFSGITNLATGGNLQTGVSFSPSFYAQGTINDPGGAYSVSNTTILGTPDVNLQPTVTGNLKGNLGKDQFINSAAFGLPNQGSNGRTVLPYVHGPAFFNTDLTAERGFKLGHDGKQNLRLRYAAFNFINHPLNSFGTGYANQTTLIFNGTSLANAAVSPTSGFGAAPQKLGARVSEISLKYQF